MKRLAFLASASAVAILAACGTSTTTGSSDACSKYFDTVAATNARCDNTGGSFDPAYKNNFVALCQATLAAPGSGVSDAYLNTCGSAMSSSTTCSFSTVKGCENPSGKLADGAACYSGTQCQSGACGKSGGSPVPTDGGVVDAGTGTGLSCGTCEARAAENAACDSAGVKAPRCQSGLNCTNALCVKPVTIPSGGACSYSGAPGTNCATGTTCIPSSGATGTCDPIPKKGEKCSFICDTGLVCTAQTCQDKVAVGGACPTGNECQSTLYCNSATKLCAATTVGKTGDACGSSTGVKCGAGLGCASVLDGPAKCVALKNKGETCGTQADQCAPFLDCISGTCQTADPGLCK